MINPLHCGSMFLPSRDSAWNVTTRTAVATACSCCGTTFNSGLQPSRGNSAAASGSHGPTIIFSRKLLSLAMIVPAHYAGSSLLENTSCGRDRGDRSCVCSVAMENETTRGSY